MNHLNQSPQARNAIAHSLGVLQARASNPILERAHRQRAVGPMFKSSLPLSESEQLGQIPGYYMRVANGLNYWIGSTLDEARVNVGAAGDKFLAAQFEYDIEYSFGQIVGGGSPWSNMSSADAVI